jgi:hypothetical protein
VRAEPSNDVVSHASSRMLKTKAILKPKKEYQNKEIIFNVIKKARFIQTNNSTQGSTDEEVKTSAVSFNPYPHTKSTKSPSWSYAEQKICQQFDLKTGELAPMFRSVARDIWSLCKPKGSTQRGFKEHHNKAWAEALKILEKELGDNIAALFHEVSLKVCIDQKDKDFLPEELNSKFTLFCHRYSVKNVDNFFDSMILARALVLIYDQVRNLLNYEG